jgi:FKBP-type peptidyl-prolyl cis-trans isomerase
MRTSKDYKHNNLLVTIGLTLLITNLAACDRGDDPDINADNAGAGPGYNTGYELGMKLALLRQDQTDIELDQALNGFRDALLDTSQIMSRTELCSRLQPAESKPAEVEYKPAESVEPPQSEARLDRFENYYAKKEDYAVLNARREGVVTLPSGVQYEVQKAGSGEPPQAADAVLISYDAYLDNGTVFDTTNDDGESLYMPLNDIVVPGLKEALLLMNTGSRWQVVIPPNMGFSTGNRMFGRRNLIYDIELITIDRAQPAQTSN